MEKSKQTGTAVAAGRSVYETKVGAEAVLRSGGKNPQLKGVVHEVLYRDSITMSPQNLATGAKGVLSSSSTAVRDDVLTMQGGRVIGRAQLKDTVGGINKTVQQAASGKYAGTKLMGTKETVTAYNNTVTRLAGKGTQVTQKMTSTGISSADTSRIAAQTIGGGVSTVSLAQVALSSGAAGAVVSGGIEVVSSGIKLANGEIDGEEFVGSVAKETVGGGLAAAGGSAVATVATAGAATILAATTAPAWLPGAIGLGVTVAVGSAIKGVWDSIFD